MSGDADRGFTRLAQEYLDDRAERHPSTATDLGDHRFDARLGDPSEQARADERRALDRWAGRLEAIDHSALSAEHRVDAAMMADGVARRVFETLATLVNATMLGLVMPALTVPAITGRRAAAQPFETAAASEWSLPGLGLGAIATAFLESDPDFTWDAARATAIRAALRARKPDA